MNYGRTIISLSFHSLYLFAIFLLRSTCQYASRRALKFLDHNLAICVFIFKASCSRKPSDLSEVFGGEGSLVGTVILFSMSFNCSNVVPILSLLESLVVAVWFFHSCKFLFSSSILTFNETKLSLILLRYSS